MKNGCDPRKNRHLAARLHLAVRFLPLVLCAGCVFVPLGELPLAGDPAPSPSGMSPSAQLSASPGPGASAEPTPLGSPTASPLPGSVLPR